MKMSNVLFILSIVSFFLLVVAPVFLLISFGLFIAALVVKTKEIKQLKGKKSKHNLKTVEVLDQKKYASNLAINNINTDNNPRQLSKPMNYGRLLKNTSSNKIANFVALDVETTGFNSDDKVIEIGMVKYIDHKFFEEYQCLVNPCRSIPKSATKIHGITDAMVKDSPRFEEIIDDVINFAGDFPIVGHNVCFDVRLMEQSGLTSFKNNRTFFDTLSIARKIDEVETDNNKLDTLCKYFGIDRTQAHRSLSDCHDTAKLFYKLYEIKTGKSIPS